MPFRQEFVQFLIYAFGDELEFAWEELDDDGSGELSEDEWFQAVKRIGWASREFPSPWGYNIYIYICIYIHTYMCVYNILLDGFLHGKSWKIPSRN